MASASVATMLCRQTRWSTCLLTGQPLSTGKVAACLLGSLYFYDAVIEFLLARTGVFLDDDSEVGRNGECTLHAWSLYGMPLKHRVSAGAICKPAAAVIRLVTPPEQAVSRPGLGRHQSLKALTSRGGALHPLQHVRPHACMAAM